MTSDGYVLKCSTPCLGNSHRVSFAKAPSLVIAVKPKTPIVSLDKAIRTAVSAHEKELRHVGIAFVLVAISGGKPEFKGPVLGFSVSDWPKWGMPQQPASPTIGSITTNVRFKSV